VRAALRQFLFALAGQVRQLRAGAVGLGRGDGFLAVGGPALALRAVFLKHLAGGLDAEVDVVAAGLMVEAPGHRDFIPHAVFAARLATFTAANVYVTGHVWFSERRKNSAHTHCGGWSPKRPENMSQISGHNSRTGREQRAWGVRKNSGIFSAATRCSGSN